MGLPVAFTLVRVGAPVTCCCSPLKAAINSFFFSQRVGV